MNRCLLLLLASVILLHGKVTAASTVEAEQRLKTAVDEVLVTARNTPNGKELTDNLRPVLQKYVSFGVMTRRAVGPGWRQFSKDQKAEATKHFTTLVIRTYARKLTPGKEPSITFKAASAPAPGRIEVPTTVLNDGSNYTVTYRLEQAEGWRITDVVIEGVSLIANYRTQLDAQFKKGGPNAVIKSLSRSADRPK
jgi:phospholipid transport system substrate-binding protein